MAAFSAARSAARSALTKTLLLARVSAAFLVEDATVVTVGVDVLVLPIAAVGVFSTAFSARLRGFSMSDLPAVGARCFVEVDFLVSLLAGAGDCGCEEDAVEDDIPSPRGALAAKGRCVVFLGMAEGDVWVGVEEEG